MKWTAVKINGGIYAEMALLLLNKVIEYWFKNSSLNYVNYKEKKSSVKILSQQIKLLKSDSYKFFFFGQSDSYKLKFNVLPKKKLKFNVIDDIEHFI